MAGYLHLFYEDWEARNPNPASVIAAKKEEIRQRAINKIQTRAAGSALVEKEFEKLYALNEGQFANAGVIERLDAANTQMSSFDQAIADLKQLVNEQGTLKEGIRLCDTCITSINNILNMGLQTHGLADSAYQEVLNFKQKLLSVRKSLKKGRLKNRTSQEQEELLDTIGAIQSNISGYLLEIAWIYAFLGANKQALGAMINVGGHSSNFGSHWKNDPRMKEDLKKIEQALAENESQSKADALFNLHPDRVSATTSWVGFQLKNFSDIGSIHVGNYTLGQIFSELGYHDMFLVNIAGSLAGNRYEAKDKIPPGLRSHDKNLSTQGAVDNLWRDLKNSTKPLAIADAIAGAMNSNFSNQVNYYVVRGKGGAGTINVIPVSKILSKIAEVLNSGADKVFGINIGGYEGNTKAASRSAYWKINVDAFDEDDPTGQTRSSIAYPEILSIIKQTKISISINFSQIISSQLT